MKTEIIEGNKLIAESTFSDLVRGSSTDERYYIKSNGQQGYYTKLKYHSSWDWQIPVWSKIALAVKTLIPKLKDAETNARWYFGLTRKYENAVFENTPEAGQKIIVELIKWYKNNNQ